MNRREGNRTGPREAVPTKAWTNPTGSSRHGMPSQSQPDGVRGLGLCEPLSISHWVEEDGGDPESDLGAAALFSQGIPRGGPPKPHFQQQRK